VTLEVIGAGLGRTGTLSLKLALERLLGGRCHHMVEFLRDPGQVDAWERALDGEAVDWEDLLIDYAGVVDWTAAAFFSELSTAYPDALVVLSVRDVDGWWRSFRDTTVRELKSEPGLGGPLADALTPVRQFTHKMLEVRFTAGWAEEAAAKEAFVRHNVAVRSAIPPGQLVEWCPDDGWLPLCAALQLPIPEAPFPHVNTTADFWAHNFFPTD
jgi:hypothetical protein